MPGAPSMNSEMKKSAKEAGSSQNEILFMRGKAMSGAPIMSGTNQLPKPPISAGMTTKKIIDQAMRGDEHVIEVLGVVGRHFRRGAVENPRQKREDLKARFLQLGAHRDRQGSRRRRRRRSRR